MQMGFYFDQTRCTGCAACRVACKDWHDLPAGPESRIRIHYVEKGTWPDVSANYMVLMCYQCLTPVCVDSCSTGALSKRDADGIVVMDEEACVGHEECGGSCLKACPYDSPQFGLSGNGKMWKCDMCLDRLAEDKQVICVEACPTRALDAAPLEDLKARHRAGELEEGRAGKLKEGQEFFYSTRTQPALVMNPKPE